MNIFKRHITLILVGILFRCGPSNEIIKLESDLSNALRANFLLTAKKTATVVIEFWENGSSKHFLSKASVDNTEHRISLLHLKPQTAYEYQIVMATRDDTIRTEVKTFVTDSLPDNLPELTLLVDSGDVFKGYLLIRNVQSPGQQILINPTGQIVWYHEFDTTLFRPFSWTEDHTILALKSDKTIHEINLKGELVYSMNYGEQDFKDLLHHEILKDKNGRIISLTRNNKVFDLSGIGGMSSDTIKGDGIIVFDSTGKKIWKWDMFEFTDPLKDPDILSTKDDWSHANSLSMSFDGHFLVSFRHFNQVWKIHSGTGEVMWKLGKGGDFLLDPDQYFYLQHAAHINSLGELMLFDNGGPERMTSRAISFRIDPETDHIQTGKVNVSLPKSLFSFKQGSAYLIDNNKVLFCSSIKKSIVVADLGGNILWHLKLSESVYRASYVHQVNWSEIVKK